MVYRDWRPRRGETRWTEPAGVDLDARLVPGRVVALEIEVIELRFRRVLRVDELEVERLSYDFDGDCEYLFEAPAS